MKGFNFIFYLIVFFGFVLPSNSEFYFSLLGVEFEIRELAFIFLPLVNLFCWSENRVFIKDSRLRLLVFCFVAIVVITEFSKHLYLNQGLGNSVKTIRIGLPLISSLLLLYSGIRADIKKVWRALLLAISISALLTLLTPFVYLPIYPLIEGGNVLERMQGRLMNANTAFVFISITLLYGNSDTWFTKDWLSGFTSFMCILILILSFNRTFLGIFILVIIYLTFSHLTYYRILKFFSVGVLLFGIVLGSYKSSEIIQSQVDRRILALLYGTKLLKTDVIKNNRDVIFEGVSERIREGYWVFGLSYDRPIFTRNRQLSTFTDFQSLHMSLTDTTCINVLLRYGVIPFSLLSLIMIRLVKTSRSRSFRLVFFMLIVASINIDTLLKQNSIFFLVIFYFSVISERYFNTNTIEGGKCFCLKSEMNKI